MKKISSRKICSAIFPLLGVAASCNPIGACEYGTPMADFEIKGKVTDSENTPIPGIEVSAHDFRTGNSGTLTGKDGSFSLSFRQFPAELVDINVKDIDGEENGGVFNDCTVSVPVVQTEKPAKDDNWYSGKYSGDIDIILKEKE